MRLSRISLGLLLVFFATFLSAQTGGSWSSAPLPPNAPAIPTTVKNAPFSAGVITQYDRVLDNGNHIHRETRGWVFRDTQGRVRTETEFGSAPGGVDKSQHITIQDPVQRVVIHLDTRNKTAIVHHLGEPAATTAVAKDAGAPRSGNAVLVAPQTAGAPTTIPLQHPEAGKRPVTRTESLGSKSIEGTLVTGTRTTRAIENSSDQPITSVTETWFSRDLQMVVLSDTDDGQAGRSMMKLVDIVRSDPNPQLFQIPPDYTIKDTNPTTASTKH